MVFKLGGKGVLPEPKVTPINIPVPPDLKSTPEQVAQGEHLYHTYCSVCHGPGVTGSGVLPDLRYMAPSTHDAFDAIVRGGAYAGKGMVSFAERARRSTGEGRARVHRQPGKQRHRVLQDRLSEAVSGVVRNGLRQTGSRLTGAGGGNVPLPR